MLSAAREFFDEKASRSTTPDERKTTSNDLFENARQHLFGKTAVETRIVYHTHSKWPSNE
jgi:hypothetical protein